MRSVPAGRESPPAPALWYRNSEARLTTLPRTSPLSRARTCYDSCMSGEMMTLIEAFQALPAEEKRAFADEVLRRSLPFDSGPLENEEIGAASAALFGVT